MKRILFPVLLLLTSPAFSQWTGPDATNRISYTKGFVGIGDIPAHRFHLKSTDDKPLIFAETPESSISFSRHFLEMRSRSTFTQVPYIAWFHPNGKRQAYLGYRPEAFSLTLENGFNFAIQGGSLAIGTADPKGYKLAVNGKAVAEEIVVKLNAQWPDYVFEDNYRLPTLEYVERYVRKNRRLPEMPSAPDVAAGGIAVSEITTLLVKKIEELTLYLIEERKTNDELRTRITKLEDLLRDQNAIR